MSHRNKNTHKLLKSAAAMGLAAAPLLTEIGAAQPAHANTAADPLIFVCLTDNDYCVTNYEFITQNQSADNVDWMLNLVWWNNADVVQAKQVLQDQGFSGVGSQRFMQIEAGHKNYVWDQDSGVKDDSYFTCTNEHAYMFAPAGDRLFVPGGWGWVVFGSSHQDYNEGSHFSCSGSAAFGWSETAEGVLASDYSSRGHAVMQNYGNVYNAQYGNDCCLANHYWESNGYDTFVSLS